MDNMKNPYFIFRSKCPVCEHSKQQTLYKRKYEDPRIVDYMKISYQGKVEYIYPNPA